MSDCTEKKPGNDLLSLCLNKQEESDTPEVNNDTGMGVSSPFYCNNEDHDPKIGFQTLAQKQIHLWRNQRCPEKTCSFGEVSEI